MPRRCQLSGDRKMRMRIRNYAAATVLAAPSATIPSLDYAFPCDLNVANSARIGIAVAGRRPVDLRTPSP